MMNTQQFENFKRQIQQLTPQQLRMLQGEIHGSIEEPKKDLLTDEERNVIATLFN
ncbi:hypothetical protein ACFFUS_09605 [Vibrio gallaecicus]|uniref:hypothetical protein n=1 Tax=Vibrio gallaecicus TaxID=552386 RepID=UPI00142E675A|nr:hypothetical protein [Vibrio gallaecicus]MDN3616641.1 hypothetical protein [Vibrio gallaecicus]